MVGHDVAYGIALTDRFGGEYFKDIIKVIKTFENNGDYPDWISSFPSVENNQLVLGFSIKLSKNMDIPTLQQQWEELYQNVPQEIKDILDKYEDEEADFHIMSGSY